MSLTTLPRTAITSYLRLARVPVDAADTVVRRRTGTDRPLGLTLTYDLVEAQVKDVAGRVLRDPELSQQAGLTRARVAKLRDAVELEAEAEQRRAEADAELEARRQEAREQEEAAERQAAEKQRQVERDAAEAKRRAEREAAEAKRKADEKAEAEKRRVEAKERKAEKVRLAEEREALEERQSAVEAKSTFNNLEQATKAAKARRQAS